MVQVCRLFVVAFVAGLFASTAAEANLVTGFEVNAPGNPDPPHTTGEAPFADLVPLPPGAIPGIPPVAQIYPNTGVDIPVPGTDNVLHTEGGSFAFAGLPDFYADGFYEWFLPERFYFDKAVGGVRFSFWALNNNANGGPDSRVFARALDENLDPFGEIIYPGLITQDGVRIGPEGFVSISPEGGLFGVIFGFAEGEVFDAPAEGFGIDALSTIPEPTTALLMGLGVLGLGLRGRRTR